MPVLNFFIREIIISLKIGSVLLCAERLNTEDVDMDIRIGFATRTRLFREALPTLTISDTIGGI